MTPNHFKTRMKEFLSIVIILLPFSCFSQTKDAKAAALLDEVSTKTKSYKSIKADFSYKMENKQAKINEEKRVITTFRRQIPACCCRTSSDM